MKMTWAAMKTRFIRGEQLDPRMFSVVTRTTPMTIHTA